MRVTLSSREIEQLKTALGTILTPATYPTPEQWGRAVMRDVKTLLRADQAFFAVPFDGSVHITGDGAHVDDAATQYENDYWRTDLVISKRRRELRLDVHQERQLYRPGEIERDVLYNEWCAPNRLFDTLGMAVDVSAGPLPAGVNVYHDRVASPAFGERGAALMHLLLPAFTASVRSYGVAIQLRESLSRLIDEIQAGVCLINSACEVLHQNRALEMLYFAEKQPDRLRSAVRRVAEAMSFKSSARDQIGTKNSGLPLERLQTVTNSYEIRGSRLGEIASLPLSLAIILVDAVNADDIRRRTAAEEVRNRFRLTARETEVALLLARRFTTEEIATYLGISGHTARHHTENVFAKTGVSSRSLIAGLFDR